MIPGPSSGSVDSGASGSSSLAPPSGGLVAELFSVFGPTLLYLVKFLLFLFKALACLFKIVPAKFRLLTYLFKIVPAKFRLLHFKVKVCYLLRFFLLPSVLIR